MFASTVAGLLPGRIALWWAEKLRMQGKSGSALAVAEARIRRLRGGDPLNARFHHLRGQVLRDMGRTATAAEAFQAGYEATRADPDALAFLARHLLRRTPRSREMPVLLDYFGSASGVVDALQLAADEQRFRKILAPRPRASSDLPSLNAVVRRQFPRWSWPRLHLGLIAASAGQWSAAARELEPIASTDATARVLLGYVRAKQERPEDARRLLDPQPGDAAQSAGLHALQAHAHRILRNPAAAVAFFERADPRGDESLLAYAESLINVGRLEEARQVLQRCGTQDASRWLLLAGSCAPTDEEALRLLARCFDDATFSGPAVARALLILQREPGRALRAYDKAVLAAVTGEHVALEPEVARVLVRHADRELRRGTREARKALRLTESVLAKLPSLSERHEVVFVRACLVVLTAGVEDARALEACDDALSRLDRTEPRVLRLAAARHALAGEFGEAGRLLDRIGGTTVHRDALRFLCGEPACSPYYRAASEARDGAFEAARQWLAEVDAGGSAPSGEAAQRLRRWLGLQEAAQLAERGDRAAATERIAEALASGLVTGPGVVNVLPLLIETGSRDAVRAALVSLPPNPVHCHLRGVFHWCEAGMHAWHASWEAAIGEWESAIACFGVALSDSDSMSTWIAERVSVYGTDTIDPDTVSRGIVAHLAQSLDRWQKTLAERDEDDGAEIGRLILALHAELSAAALIGSAPDPARFGASMGPLAIRCFSLERPFAELMARLRERRRDTVDAFERSCSDLRYAALLEQRGQTQAALDMLRSVGTFPPCNPAFGTSTQGRRLFERAARKLETELLLRLGKEEISSTADRIDAGIGHWRQALALSRNGTREATIAAIQQTAIGRARTLDDRSRYEEAICLLERVNEICADDSIRGELATIHAHAAIEAVNRNDDWERGVEGLRKARELNRRSPFIDRNLVIALRHRDESLGQEQYIEHLQEALAIAETNLSVDRDNTEWQELVQNLRGELMFLAFSGADVRRRPPKPPMLTAGLSTGRGVEHRQRGMAYLVSGRYGDAAKEFQNALRLDPNDHESREQLAGTLMRMLGG